MIKVNPVHVNPVKTLECAGKYKNGATFNLRMKSEAPRMYELDCLSLNKNGEILGGFCESYKEGTADGFAEWSKNFITKLQRYCDDSDILNKVSEFFTSISK